MIGYEFRSRLPNALERSYGAESIESDNTYRTDSEGKEDILEIKRHKT